MNILCLTSSILKQYTATAHLSYLCWIQYSPRPCHLLPLISKSTLPVKPRSSQVENIWKSILLNCDDGKKNEWDVVKDFYRDFGNDQASPSSESRPPHFKETTSCGGTHPPKKDQDMPLSMPLNTSPNSKRSNILAGSIFAWVRFPSIGSSDSE